MVASLSVADSSSPKHLFLSAELVFSPNSSEVLPAYLGIDTNSAWRQRDSKNAGRWLALEIFPSFSQQGIQLSGRRIRLDLLIPCLEVELVKPAAERSKVAGPQRGNGLL